jgi:chitinase
LIDRFNMMTYDLVNRLSVATGHHTGLYSTSRQVESADNALRYLDSLKIPRNKIVIGAAFYSRVYEKVDSTGNGLYRPCRFKGFVTYKSYAGSFTKANGYHCYWDNEAKAPWCYNRAKQLFATFDDKRSVQLKTQYAIDRQLQGIMFWELRQDKPSGGLLDAIYEVKARAKLPE